MIHGVRTKPLTTIADERGWLYEILRRDEELFLGFGQVYLTAVYPGVVKAWHCHEHQTDHFVVVAGMVKFVVADLREGSPTHGEVTEYFIGDQNRLLIQIPPGVYHGMKGIGDKTALAINCPTEPYRHEKPDEIRLPFDTKKIKYDWGVKHG
jgi:dTDP-4-dehydrorhamnose 3,5-epimerase